MKDGVPYITATHDKNNPRSGGVMKQLGMKYQYSYEEQWQPKNIPVSYLSNVSAESRRRPNEGISKILASFGSAFYRRNLSRFLQAATCASVLTKSNRHIGLPKREGRFPFFKILPIQRRERPGPLGSYLSPRIKGVVK